MKYSPNVKLNMRAGAGVDYPARAKSSIPARYPQVCCEPLFARRAGRRIRIFALAADRPAEQIDGRPSSSADKLNYRISQSDGSESCNAMISSARRRAC